MKVKKGDARNQGVAMDLFEAIHHRRSIRKFTDEAVTDEDVRTLLQAAMTAPTACNQQPWQFAVVTDRDKLDAVKSFSPHAHMASHAPLGILICGDTSLEPRCPGYWVQDCSAAMQNLLLAVHGLGLGAVWTGVYPVEDRIEGFRQLLNVPERIVPFGFAVIGHPAQPSGPADRYREDRVHANGW